MSKFNYLTEAETHAISQVSKGADITSFSLAQTLRSVEKKQKENDHNLIDICDAMGTYDVKEKLPYFGCIALNDGFEAIENI